MRLGQLLDQMVFNSEGNELDVEIRDITYDSRKVTKGSLFVALRGHKQDGHVFMDDAVRRGAAAIIAESFEGLHPPEPQIPLVRVSDSREALSSLSAGFYAQPCEGMNLVGITGTNGKTTTSYVLESILSAGGAGPGVIGTIEYRYGEKRWNAPVTTPESLDLMRILRDMADMGAQDVVMEVSSHSLEQGRVRDCDFRVAVFTNFTRDHLDYHGSMDAYFRAKSKLFTQLADDGAGPQKWAVINMDDPMGESLIKVTHVPVLTYGLGRGCAVRAEDVRTDRSGLKARLETPKGSIGIRSRLLGDFNIHNILAAAAAALCLDMTLETVALGIERMQKVPGRLEPVSGRFPAMVVVDYAHTPDALSKAINAVRPLSKNRIITVFGCGGDRDKGKRHEMGLVAGKQSDVVVVTSDNPRTEDPMSIALGIEEGVRQSGKEMLPKGAGISELGQARSGYVLELDRRAAILLAIKAAGHEDIVLIAGKGHEDYQIVGKTKRSFDDRKVVASAVVQGA